MRRRTRPRRPPLAEVPLGQVLPFRPGVLYVTCSPEQWDGLLDTAYQAGAVLLEVGDDNTVRRAFRLAADRN